MRNITLVLITLLLMSGCGYIPSAKYSRAIVGENISTSVVISLVDPENSVIIKDGVDSAIIEVFHASLTTKALSTTHLTVKLSNPSYAPIQYDADGFVVSYRTTVNLRITRSTKGEDSKDYNVRGTYDFSITPNAIISDNQRFDAIKFSSTKAIRSFVAQVSAEGARAKLVNDSAQSKEVAIEIDAVQEEVVTQSVVQQKVVRQKTKQETVQVQKTNAVKTTSVASRLDELDEAYTMKMKGLLSEEEFNIMKQSILQSK